MRVCRVLQQLRLLLLLAFKFHAPSTLIPVAVTAGMPGLAEESDVTLCLPSLYCHTLQPRGSLMSPVGRDGERGQGGCWCLHTSDIPAHLLQFLCIHLNEQEGMT